MHIIKRTNLKTLNFSQVKNEQITQKCQETLFHAFKLEKHLIKANIKKIRGINIVSMLMSMFYLTIGRYRSMLEGLSAHEIRHHKNAYHRMLNNTYYKWRKLLIGQAKLYTEKYSPDEAREASIIVDDTAKRKTGRRVERVSRFRDHSTRSYFTGYQATFLSWYNGRTCIFVNFVLKTGKKLCKGSKLGVYAKKSHTAKRIAESRQKKTSIVIVMLKRVLFRRFAFKYVLWDSWYNCTESFKFVFKTLLPKGKHLVSMVKKSNEKYHFNDGEKTISQICKSEKKWSEMRNGIKYKTAIIGIIDKTPKQKRAVIGYAVMCFFLFPGKKRYNYKVIISTNTELSAEQVLEKYTERWSIEVAIKDLKQHMGYDQSMSSTYASQIADLTLRCIFYNMLCSEKERVPRKTIYQITIQFNSKLEDQCFGVYFQALFEDNLVCFLEYVLSVEITDIRDVLSIVKQLLDNFWNSNFYEEKIVEVEDNRKKQNKKVA